MPDPHAHAHAHVHGHEEYPLTPPEAFQMLCYFLSAPDEEAARDVKAYLPDLRNIAFYYRFMLDEGALSDAQIALVRQFISQVYAAQELLRRFELD